ncbi:MAG: hypothetical protein JXR76_14645 [Deltaproteobacteria bacterium]|nr:hypothetical protein [Deltaproteobacteria bacterium]
MKKLPPIPICDAMQIGGVVRLQGKVHPAAKPLVAPLSGRKCVYCEATVEQ